jgi:hypothetical protein
MAKVTTFTNPVLDEIRTEAEKVLNAHFASRGIRAEAGRGLYDRDRTRFELKIEFVAHGGLTREENDAAEMAALYELNLEASVPASIFGRHGLRTASVDAKIVGYRSKARKKPWIVIDTGDPERKLIFPDKPVLHWFAKSRAGESVEETIVADVTRAAEADGR